MPELENKSDKNSNQLEQYFDAFADFLKNGKLDEITQFVSPDSREISRQYLQIYRNGFLKTSIEALRNNFSTISKLIPEKQFSLLAKQYIDTHPPRTGTLTGYGKYFPNFLAQQRILEQDINQWLTDIAKLDFAWLDSLYAEKSPALTGARVQELSENEIDVTTIKVCLNQCCQIVHIEHAVFEVWQQYKTQSNDLNSLQDHLDITAANSCILFWQHSDQVITRELEEDELIFLKVLDSAQSIGDAASQTLERHPEADIATIFSNLLTHEILMEINDGHDN